MFEKESNVTAIQPKDILGAATSELDHRFTGLDVSIRASIMADMSVEDDALEQYIETCRLDKWHQTALDLAKQDYDEEIAEKTDDGKRLNEAEKRLEEIEADIEKKEQVKASSLLHSKLRYKPKFRLNGSTNFRASMKQY